MMIPILGLGQVISSEAPYLDHLNTNHNLLNKNIVVQILETTLVDDRKKSRSQFDSLQQKRPALSDVNYYITSLKFVKKESGPWLRKVEDLDYPILYFKKYNR